MEKVKKTFKRFQYYTSTGLSWSNWFEIDNDAPRLKYQLSNKLLNEYKEEYE